MPLSKSRFYGKWAVLSSAGSNKHRQDQWNCICECGTQRVVSGLALRNGHSKSCGCSHRKRPFESAYNVLVTRASENLSLTYEEFLEFAKISECYYCGGNVNWTSHGTAKRGDNSHACHLDRLDPAVGYTKDNCVVACWPCNRMKQNLTYVEFMERVKEIWNHKR